MQTDPTGPLTGVRVLDASRVLAGPFCGQMLGDLGAEVLKLERPGSGDETRGWGPPFLGDLSAYYLSCNRNKRAFTLDLGKPEAVAGCRILWEFDGKKYHYKVEGSADAKSWTMLVDETKANLDKQIQTHSFKATGTRYVRLTITALPEDGSWPSFYEFEVHGTKLVKPEPPRPPIAKDLLKGVKVVDGFDVTIFDLDSL